MEFLVVKNWNKYQHYKDRNPPWVKFHFEILTSADWVMLSDASKLLACVCILVASRHEGKVPNDPQYIKRIAYLEKTPNLKALIDSGFLENPLALDSGCKQKQADATPETEKERERNNATNSFEEFWKAWPVARRKVKPDAQKAWNMALKKTSPEMILEGERRYLLTKEVKDGFAPYPAKWLKGERWAEDDAAEPEMKWYETPANRIPSPAGG